MIIFLLKDKLDSSIDVLVFVLLYQNTLECVIVHRYQIKSDH